MHASPAGRTGASPPDRSGSRVRPDFPEAAQMPFAGLYAASRRTRGVVAGATLVALLAGAWAATYAEGGTRSVAPHLFYLPIIFAAGRFRWRGALVTALVSGVLVGPLVPLDVANGVPQGTASWLSRLVMFVVIAMFVSWLFSESRTGIITKVRDAHGARELREALARGELEVHYQPVFDLGAGVITGAEALVRWRHPVRGLVHPSEFIPLAERTGAITSIDAFVLNEATLQTARWTAGSGIPLTVAVNISGAHLDDPNLVTRVESALLASTLDAARLCVEITETAVVRDFPRALLRVIELHDLGVSIALDDFGTGLSSLAYLERLPIDVIKIDRTFVHDIDTNARCAAVVAGIAQLSRALGVSTVAEGIERRSQLDALRGLGFDQGQGFLVGPALLPAEFDRRVVSQPGWCAAAEDDDEPKPTARRPTR